MEQYTEFTEVSSNQPFSVRNVTMQWGWYFITRGLWTFRTSGGKWYHWPVFVSAQIVMSVFSLVIDTVIALAGGLLYVGYHIARFLFKRIFKKVVEPILQIFAVAFALTALYAFYKSGLWTYGTERLTELFPVLFF